MCEPPESQPPLFRERRFLVSANTKGWRLDSFLAHKIGRMSRSKAARIIRGGGVTIESSVERGRVKPNSRVQLEDCVVLHQSLDAEQLLDHHVSVLFQNAEWVAFDKPAGMLVHPTARAYHNTLIGYGERQGLGPLFVVHRLDRETSGCLLMARDSVVAKELTAIFAKGKASKYYQAVVFDPNRRWPLASRGENEEGLGYDRESSLPELKIGPGCWPAKTCWQCIKRLGPLALLDVQIQGGRQHQIRAHLALAGTPIWGDKLYLWGEAFFKAHADGLVKDYPAWLPEFHLLHAKRLAIDGLSIAFSSPLPQRFEEFICDGGFLAKLGEEAFLAGVGEYFPHLNISEGG